MVKLEVSEQIEELRLDMQKMASDKELTDPRVVRVSQMLDELINKFYFQNNRGVVKGEHLSSPIFVI